MIVNSDRQLTPEIVEAGLSPDEFKAAFRNHAAGVALITAQTGDEPPVALTATSVFSVSAAPPLLVFSISELSSSAPTILRADTVVIHLLGADQLELARLGATSGIDRFADTSQWSRLPSGEPYFPNVPVWIRGRVVNQMEAGISAVVAVLALESGGSTGHSAEPLVYHNRVWHRLHDGSRIEG